MNINFHYAAVKVLALHAGFSPTEAELIAYASQYVDDETAYKEMGVDKDPGVPGIRYSNGQFDPICTAHKQLDYVRGALDRRARVVVYSCFHFVPSFKPPSLKCRRQVVKNGTKAKALVVDALDKLDGSAGEERQRALIRLGIALHSYADTWSHQGFSGLWDHDNNDIQKLRVKSGNGWKAASVMSQLLSYAAPDIGHAEAGVLPDASNMSWDCTPPKMVRGRDNCTEFLEAAEALLELLSGATGGGGAWSAIRPKLEKCFREPVEGDDMATALRHKRNNSWRREFPEAKFTYDERTWFEQALWPRGGLIDIVGSGLHLDPLDYDVLPGRKYFHFHAMAKEQRDALESDIWPLV